MIVPGVVPERSFAFETESVPLSMVTAKSPSRLTLSPLSPSAAINVVTADSVPVIVVAAVAVTRPLVLPLIVLRSDAATDPVSTVPTKSIHFEQTKSVADMCKDALDNEV